MHRNDHKTANAGLHHDGDPQHGIPATIVPAATMNALQEELANFIESRGIVLNKADNTQLKQAILDAIGKTVEGGDFVTKTEFRQHAQGEDPHQQYALQSMLGDAAGKDVGTGAHQVAAGNHEHSLYELKDSLKQGAYRDVGSGSNQLAAGNHSHPEFLVSSATALSKQLGYRPLSWNAWQGLISFTLPRALTSYATVRVTLPLFRAEENGRGAHPGCELWVSVNGVQVLTTRIHNPADRYGNGLSFGAIPIASLVLPPGTSGLDISVHPALIASMREPSISAGVVVVEVIDLYA